MNSYIERYTSAVTKRLPQKLRQEVEEEIVFTINEMLKGDQSDENIKEVLKKLGNPRILASKYCTKDKTFISPYFFDDFITTLKITFLVFGILTIVSSVYMSLMSLETTNVFTAIIEVFLNASTDLINSLFKTFSIVTIIFWIITKKIKEEQLNEWKIDDLPKIEKKDTLSINMKDSIIKIAFSSVFYIVWILMLTMSFDKFGIYDQGVYVSQIFNFESVKNFIPFFILLGVFSLILDSLKIYYKKWNLKIIIAHASYLIAFNLVAILFVLKKNLINIEVYDLFLINAGFTFGEITSFFSILTKCLAVLLIVITSIDLTILMVKFKNNKKSLLKI